MRESQSLRGEVKALAANGKMTGTVLTVLPLFIAAMMVTVNPGYLDILFQTEQGKNLIFICIACLILAHFIIRKIVDIRL